MMHWLIYIDPGSGSFLVQAIVAGVLGIGYFFKNIRNAVRLFFWRLFHKKTKD